MHLDEQHNRQILRVLVGSRAHNLHREDSDFDYRGVFVVPTADLLSLGTNLKTTNWVEGRVDDTSWEVGHFLHLATQCNPNILDVFRGERQHLDRQQRWVAGTGFVKVGDRDLRAETWGARLVMLFPHVLSRRRVLDAFLGYSRNQLKKLMDQEAVDTPRVWKFGVTYLRALLNGIDLLQTGTYSMEVVDTRWHNFLVRVRAGERTRGIIIDEAVKLQADIHRAYAQTVLPEEPNLEAVNEFLLKLRREFWS